MQLCDPQSGLLVLSLVFELVLGRPREERQLYIQQFLHSVGNKLGSLIGYTETNQVRPIKMTIMKTNLICSDCLGAAPQLHPAEQDSGVPGVRGGQAGLQGGGRPARPLRPRRRGGGQGRQRDGGRGRSSLGRPGLQICKYNV